MSKPKRARMLELSTINVTQTSLASIVRNIRDNGLPTVASRSSLARQRQELADTMTPYGTLITVITLPLDTGPMAVEVQAPLPMLYTLGTRSVAFANLLLRSYGEHPCSPTDPWRVVLYADEVSPTNPLHTGPDHREVQAVYWSFLEFGMDALCNEAVWLVCAGIRSELVEHLSGGMSQLVSILLKTCFWDDGGHNLELAGIIIELAASQGTLRLCARFGFVVADEKALKEITGMKGAGGRMHCGRCKNRCKLYYYDSLPVEKRNDFVPIHATASVNLRLHTDESVRRVFQRLQHAVDTGMGSNSFVELERRLGYGLAAKHLVMETRLMFGAISMVMFDWMHVYLVKGIFSWEVGHLVHAFWTTSQRLKIAPITYADFHEYLGLWQWPRALASPHNLCNPKHADSHASHGALGGTASELLGVGPVIVNYLVRVASRTALGAACQDEIDSCIACVGAVELLQSVARSHVTPARLGEAITKHLDAFTKAYGPGSWKPKHHMATHLPEMLASWGTLLSCFVHERHHQLVRKRTLARKTLDRYEGGLIGEITTDMLATWAEDPFADGLVNAREASARLRAQVFEHAGIPEACATPLFTGTKAFVNGCRITHGDVALVRDAGALPGWPVACSPRRGWGVAEVWCHLEFAGTSYSFVSPWPVVADEDRCVKAKMVDNPIIVSTSELLCPVVHRRGEHTVMMLVPLQFQ